jgi:hypothetical protein
MLRCLCLSLMLVGLYACDDDPPKPVDDAGDHDVPHDHDVSTDAADDTHDHANFCTLDQINECQELGAGAGCCESTNSCYVPPCAPPDCCPIID